MKRGEVLRQLMPGINALFGHIPNDFDMPAAMILLRHRGVDDFVLYVTWRRSFQNLTGMGKPVIDRNALNVWPQLAAANFDPENGEPITCSTIEAMIHTRTNLLLKEKGNA